MDQSKTKNALQDARHQLASRIGLGSPWPMVDTMVSTEHVNGDPNHVNSADHVYSKVSFDHQEKVYIHQPQAGVRYYLIDADLISPDYETRETGLRQLIAQALPERQAQAPDFRHSALQPKLTLLTPAINEDDRRFAVVAEERKRGLLTVLRTRITVIAGINESLTVLARPMDNALAYGSPMQMVLQHNQALQVQVLEAQAECAYWLSHTAVEPNPNSSNYTPEGNLLLSQAYTVGDEVQTASLDSIPFQENLKLRVYAKFVDTDQQGYLQQGITVGVRPNPLLPVEADLSTTQALAAQPDSPAFANPHGHPNTAFYNTTLGVKVLQSQASKEYHVVLRERDEAVDTSALGGVWSGYQAGNGDTLLLPLNKPCKEDITLAVEARDRQYTWVPKLDLNQTLKIYVYPSPDPTVVVPPAPVASGSDVVLPLENTQEGVYYQAYDAANDTPLGNPQYHSKNKRIEEGTVGIDLSINAWEEGTDLQLTIPAVAADLSLYILATKPVSGLAIRLKQTVDISVA